MRHRLKRVPNFTTKEILSMTAGKIWLVLSKNGQISIPQLIKLLNEKDTYVYLALGWLTFEEKIAIIIKNKTEYVALTSKEREGTVIPSMGKERAN